MFILNIDWFIPYLKGYDATFLLQVMKGEKKCLPVGFQTGFNLNYFRKGETLNKAYIINKIANNQKFIDYLPDNVSPMNLSRDFLLTVSFLYLTSLVGSVPITGFIQRILCNYKGTIRK